MGPDQEQARRDLIADISHDLRTPLVAMRGYLELLVARGDSLSAEDRKRYAAIALRQSEHLGRLVDDLFELAKLDFRGLVLDCEPFAVGELASDVVQKFALAASARGVALEVAVAADTPPLEADLRLVERVLENLVGNALGHTPAGGRVEVRVASSAVGVELQVIDTGAGIPAEALPFVFDRHYRGAASGEGDVGEGAGLGLAIAKKIVELHGGSIRVESEPRRGSRFVIDLPSRRDAAPEAESPASTRLLSPAAPR
jgi:signal transduction histidine kinase